MKSKEKLYFVLDYCAGGELFFHLSRMKKFPEHVTCFYCAQITSALDALHNIVSFTTRNIHICAYYFVSTGGSVSRSQT
jgi:serine/threonine protein kinase